MPRTIKLFLPGWVAVMLLVGACAARADTISLEYSGNGGTDLLSATLTTTPFSGGQATVIGISGTYNGMAISGLLSPGTCCSDPGNDNILYFPGAALDWGGLGFQIGAVDYDLYDWGGTAYVIISAPANNLTNVGFNSSTFNGGGFTLTFVPEPGSLTLIATGLLSLAAAALRRSRQV